MVGDVLDDADVVRDEQVAHAQLALQLAQQIQDLRLHRDIQRRGRLVTNDQPRRPTPCRMAGRVGGARRPEGDGALDQPADRLAFHLAKPLAMSWPAATAANTARCLNST